MPLPAENSTQKDSYFPKISKFKSLQPGKLGEERQCQRQRLLWGPRVAGSPVSARNSRLNRLANWMKGVDVKDDACNGIQGLLAALFSLKPAGCANWQIG